jgi:hypothetical protein
MYASNSFVDMWENGGSRDRLNELIRTDFAKFGKTIFINQLWNQFSAGLPDGFFSNQKSNFGQILAGL